MVIEIDYDRALELLEDAVTLKGDDYVYPLYTEGYVNESFGSAVQTCSYIHDGKPSCIIGHALHAAGVDIETIQSFEGKSIDAIFDEGMLRGVVDISKEALHLWTRAQEQQDASVSWGEAVQEAVWSTSEKF